MAAGNFILLGARNYAFVNDGLGELRPDLSSALGLLRESALSAARRGGPVVKLSAQTREFLLSPELVILTTANAISDIYRRAHLDSIGLKTYGPDGNLTGELRLTGFFSPAARAASPRGIPLVRLKAAEVLRRAGYAPDSHSGKALAYIVDTFPRRDLMQIPASQLFEFASQIERLNLHPRTRVFVHEDVFRRYASVLIYINRDRYNTSVRERICDFLARVFTGRIDTFTPFFPDGPMVRLHIVVWRENGELPCHAQDYLEAEIEKIVRTWRDELRDRLLQHYGDTAAPRIAKYLSAFPAGYRDTNRPGRALADIERLESLTADNPTAIDIFSDTPGAARELRATLLQLDKPINLSRRVPILENLGFHVVSERTFELSPTLNSERRRVFLHDSVLEIRGNGSVAIASHRRRLEAGFLAVWRGKAANDRYNGLILQAGLDWREAALIRTYAAYLRQTGAPFGQVYLGQTLNRQGPIVRELVEAVPRAFQSGAWHSAGAAAGSGGKTRETHRGHAAKSAGAGRRPGAAPLPQPHSGDAAHQFLPAQRRRRRARNHRLQIPQRAGGRSARAQTLCRDFRLFAPLRRRASARRPHRARGLTLVGPRPGFPHGGAEPRQGAEVKNVVIVPQGAKGGFVPKKLHRLQDREAVQAEGIACYKSFVASLLSLTDNMVDGKAQTPPGLIRHDGDDAYLVVAADKGTATFSDIANGIAVGRGFWLGDAFASGGSAGYDHKKMGITARGAWEAVKRHFREMNIDIQTTPFRVAGVGDMSGDVFGNGMLLSKAIKLVAAFDHRDIFIDPDPDPAMSWAERQPAVRSAAFELAGLQPRAAVQGRRRVQPDGEIHRAGGGGTRAARPRRA